MFLNSIFKGKIPLSALEADYKTKALIYKLNALEIFEQLKVRT
jgi:hypothetical protein